MLKQQLEQDLKTALLAGDRLRVNVLRSLKSAIGYVEVEKGAKQEGLSEGGLLAVFSKEAKKRQESADLYLRGNDSLRADQELKEKAIIESYLPPQLDEASIGELVDKAIAEAGSTGAADMGRIISIVKEQAAGTADGATIARLVKEKLNT